mgnify:CR=1 FL=1
MKIVLLNDTHFGARNDSLIFDDYFHKFYDKIFFPYIKEHNIKTLIHLGDVVDRRKYINYRIAHNFRHKFLQRLWDEKIDTHIIVGNHDIYFRNTNKINAVQELCTTPDGLHEPWIYEEPKVVDFDGLKILMLPWINPENEEHSLKTLETAHADILIAHLDLNGYQMTNGVFQTHGYDRSIVSRFEKVITGHFHKKSDDGQVFYLGCQSEMTWSDYDNQKGFHIFDTATRELERIVNPYTIYKKIYYDDTENDYTKHDVSQYKEHYVKLIVVNKKDLYKFDMFVDRLLMADAFDVKIIEDFSELDASNVSDDIVENTEDTMTLLEKYINELDVTLDKNRLKNTMKALYNEAQDLEI